MFKKILFLVKHKKCFLDLWFKVTRISFTIYRKGCFFCWFLNSQGSEAGNRGFAVRLQESLTWGSGCWDCFQQQCVEPWCCDRTGSKWWAGSRCGIYEQEGRSWACSAANARERFLRHRIHWSVTMSLDVYLLLNKSKNVCVFFFCLKNQKSRLQ